MYRLGFELGNTGLISGLQRAPLLRKNHINNDYNLELLEALFEDSQARPAETSATVFPDVLTSRLPALH
jgi:hypothetical protein